MAAIFLIHYLTLWQRKPVRGRVPLRYFGDIEEEYEKRNQNYIQER